VILDSGSLIGRLLASTVQNEWADCTAVFKPHRETAQDETCRGVGHVIWKSDPDLLLEIHVTSHALAASDVLTS